MKKQKTGLESGVSRKDKFKGSPENVYQPAPKSQIPTMKKQKVGKFIIC
jgi:hypothetical protein